MSKSPEEISSLAETCLAQILSGQESLASILKKYPREADELKPHLEAGLWLTPYLHDLDPRPGFVSASRQRLVAQIKQEQTASMLQKTSQPRKLPLRQSLFKAKPYRLTYQLITLILLVFAFTVLGNVTTAAAKLALPGDAMYPVKLAFEKIRIASTLDKTKKAALQVEFSQRRLAEIEELALDGNYNELSQAVIRLNDNIDQTVASLDMISAQNPTAVQELASSLQSALERQPSLLAIMVDLTPESAREDLLTAIQVSQKGAAAMGKIIARVTPPPGLSKSPTQTLTPTVTTTPTPKATQVRPTHKPTDSTGKEQSEKEPNPNKPPTHTPDPDKPGKPDHPNKPDR